MEVTFVFPSCYPDLANGMDDWKMKLSMMALWPYEAERVTSMASMGLLDVVWGSYGLGYSIG